jgi:hypothetical protein
MSEVDSIQPEFIPALLTPATLLTPNPPFPPGAAFPPGFVAIPDSDTYITARLIDSSDANTANPPPLD